MYISCLLLVCDVKCTVGLEQSEPRTSGLAGRRSHSSTRCCTVRTQRIQAPQRLTSRRRRRAGRRLARMPALRLGIGQ